MVKLRLKRMGVINKPFYRIVAVDSRKKRDGKYIESLGYYDPKTEPLTCKIDIEKAIAEFDIIALLVKHKEFTTKTTLTMLNSKGALDFCGAFLK